MRPFVFLISLRHAALNVANGRLRFAGHPLVAGPPHIRFYAGVPLLLNGLPVGILCVNDLQPRTLLPWQL